MRFVDSNVFVYHLAGDPSYVKRAREILLKIESGEPTTTSTLVIAQVCAYLRWKKHGKKLDNYHSFSTWQKIVD